MDKDLYSFKKLGTDCFEIVLSDESHLVFKAHFPGNPLLPGFIFLHICENVLGVTMVEVVKAKFISFAKPNDVLNLSILRKGELFHVEFMCKERKICTISFKGEDIGSK